MQRHATWQRRLNLTTPDAVFHHLNDTLSKGITTFAYFVNWQKVDSRHKAVELELNLLNSLVGKPNPEAALGDLLKRYPEVTRAFPCLLAIRHEPREVFRILTSYAGGKLVYEEFDFTVKPNLTDAERAKLVRFAKDSGILDLFTRRVASSLPDYHRGVEVGLDSNGRKNRGGTLMETVVTEIVQDICTRRKWADPIPHANAATIQQAWGVKVPVAETQSEPDLAVWTGKKLWLVEANFYNNGGSKLKATAGEYQAKFPTYLARGIGAVWVTDGQGWLTAQSALREAFNALPFVLNLEMTGRGCLEDILAG